MEEPPGVGERLGSSYRRLWWASGGSNLADGMAVVALPVLTLQLSPTPGAVATVALAQRLPWLLFALHAGALADRLDRRRVMVSVNLVRAGTLAALAGLTAADLASVGVVVGVAFALGSAETLFDTSAQSVLPMLVGRDQLPRANGRLQAVELLANQFVGPPLGGALAVGGIAVAVAGSATAYLAASGLLLLLTGSFRPVRSGPRTTIRADVAHGLRYLWGHRVLRTLAAMVGAMNLAFAASFAVLPVHAISPGPLGLDGASFGLLLAASAVGSLVGSVAVERLAGVLGRARLLVGCVVLAALPLLAMACWEAVGVVAVALAVAGAGIVMWNVVTVSLRQQIVPDELLGRVNAGYRLVAWGTMPLGAGIGGLVAELFDVRVVFAIAGIACLAVLVGARCVTERAIADAWARSTVDA
jgi:MFS family permease